MYCGGVITRFQAFKFGRGRVRPRSGIDLKERYEHSLGHPGAPKHEHELILPARNGALRVGQSRRTSGVGCFEFQ
jgi:hypothetical protein